MSEIFIRVEGAPDIDDLAFAVLQEVSTVKYLYAPLLRGAVLAVLHKKGVAATPELEQAVLRRVELY